MFSRAALHETAAAQQIASLRHRKENPPQRHRVVVIIGKIGRQRAFDGFVVAAPAVKPPRPAPITTTS
jgi:hypothetical protein